MIPSPAACADEAANCPVIGVFFTWQTPPVHSSVRVSPRPSTWVVTSLTLWSPSTCSLTWTNRECLVPSRMSSTWRELDVCEITLSPEVPEWGALETDIFMHNGMKSLVIIMKTTYAWYEQYHSISALSSLMLQIRDWNVYINLLSALEAIQSTKKTQHELEEQCNSPFNRMYPHRVRGWIYSDTGLDEVDILFRGRSYSSEHWLESRILLLSHRVHTPFDHSCCNCWNDCGLGLFHVWSMVERLDCKRHEWVDYFVSNNFICAYIDK